MIKKIITNITLVIISILIGFIIGELGVRLYFFGNLKEPLPEVSLRRPDGILGWALYPNKSAFQQTLDYTTFIKTNSKGLRDVERSYIKDKDVFRIVILGDSFMEAYQVQLEDSFSKTLEKKLDQASKIKIVEVVNMGIAGFGTAQEYLQLITEGLKYSPDMVILSFLAANDVRNNSRYLETKLWQNENHFKVVARPFYEYDSNGNLALRKPDFNKAVKWKNKKNRKLKEKSDKKLIVDRSIIYRLLKVRMDAISAKTFIRKYDLNAMLGIYFRKYDEHWQDAWKITKQLICEIKKTSEKNGAQFLLVSIPMRIQVDSGYHEKSMEKYLKINNALRLDLDKPELILREFIKEKNMHFVSLLDDFRTHYSESSDSLYFTLRDQHWNEKGHEFAAKLVSNYIIKNDLIKNTVHDLSLNAKTK